MTCCKNSEPKRRGPKPKPRIQFPPAQWDEWVDPPTFHEALNLHMRRHGDLICTIHAGICRPGENLDRTTIAAWRRGSKEPKSVLSLKMLGRIEQRYRLPSGYFKGKLLHRGRSITGHEIAGISRSERGKLAWHLPDDFDARSLVEQQEILSWARKTILSGATSYRRFQLEAAKVHYAVRFPHFLFNRQIRGTRAKVVEATSRSPRSDGTQAPPALIDELSALLQFKMAALTPLGHSRNGTWGKDTAEQNVEHFGLLFGALAAKPNSRARGYGIPLDNLCFAHLAFPTVWDWYVQWRQQRRGFYTRWEVNMLQTAAALTREATGWLRQTPQVCNRLTSIPGLISPDEAKGAKANWDTACSNMYRHALVRIKEIGRLARVHRDPFEPILIVLEADSPLAQYRKIVDEIVRLMPDEKHYPLSCAESVRSLLMIRFGLHTGLRQKNLRELLVCPRSQLPMTEAQLADRKAGEVRWNNKCESWEVFIPSIAFKNANSSFFNGNPFQLQLPDVGGLYGYIESYVEHHRRRLLHGAPDPGTFFVKTVKATSKSARYDQDTFYEAWRHAVQRYGIYNPYTGRGAIEGLLPHGPHSVRDVLATHVLKQTGSYEQASYAIQDTPKVVSKHYGRFLPKDKVAIAARDLNEVWK